VRAERGWIEIKSPLAEAGGFSLANPFALIAEDGN